MRKSFRQAIDDATGPALGCFTSLEPPLPAQVIARAGFDFVIVDMEHSPYTAKQATQFVHLIAAASGGQTVPLVRIPSHDVAWVKWGLDCGSAGIVIPMVNNRQEMEAIIDRAIYPPGGSRSFGPIHAAYADVDPKSTIMSYYENRKNVAVVPIIESRLGVENAEAILSVPGVTGCFIGPNDLRLSLGCSPGQDGPEPVFVNAIKKIIEVGNKYDVPIGCLGGGEEVCKLRTQLGMRFLLCGSDFGALAEGLSSQLKAARGGIKSAL